MSPSKVIPELVFAMKAYETPADRAGVGWTVMLVQMTAKVTRSADGLATASKVTPVPVIRALE
jgi:hypothetical protein